MKKHVGEIPKGYRLNKYGYLVKAVEFPDPVPKASKVAFKRPLSAHQRVLQALRTHEQMKALDALPGDDTFDGPDIENMTPHQLMTDPVSGEEMTAGEYVMLQHERAEASRDVAKAVARKKQKKLAAPVVPPTTPPADESGD